MSIRITQGQFSFLPDLTDEQITRQIKYAIDNGWAVNVEYTDDPHPRNTYWEMWGLPEVNECRKTYPNHYVRLSAFDSTRGVESLKMCFLVNRPADEPGFRLERTEMQGRNQRYALRSYATEKPAGERY